MKMNWRDSARRDINYMSRSVEIDGKALVENRIF
jgi:hypothetical protein